MSNKTTIVIIVVLVVILGFVWWSLGTKKNGSVLVGDTQTTSLPESITVNHYFNNGEHSLEGTLTLPTPCHSLSYDAIVAESYPEQVMVKFVTKPGEGLCTQILADKFFRVAFNASKDAVISATLDGKAVRLVFSETKEGITK